MTEAMNIGAPMRLRLAQGAGRRSWGPSVFAAVVVAAFLLATLRSGVQATGGAPSGGGYSDSWIFQLLAFPLYLLAAAVVVAGVLVGRRWPVRGALLTVLPFVATFRAETFVWGWFLGTMAVVCLTALDGIRRAIFPFAVAVLLAASFCSAGRYAVVPTGVVYIGPEAWIQFVAYLVWMSLALAIALTIGVARRTWARGIEVEAVEQHAYEVESLAGERARLARDLHDVVAHHVSLVAVRAESAPYVHPSLNDEARSVLAAIATDAREALTELRQVLVVLQRTDGSDRAPQPTACDVDSLVESAVAAGQPVDVVGTWSDVGPAIGYVLYRAVQEGLTNVRRHAPGATTHLVRTQSRDQVGFTLSNRAQSVDEPGRGLIGMRERVESLGGSLDTEVVDGQFVLTVSLPVVA